MAAPTVWHATTIGGPLGPGEIEKHLNELELLGHTIFSMVTIPTDNYSNLIIISTTKK